MIAKYKRDSRVDNLLLFILLLFLLLLIYLYYYFYIIISYYYIKFFPEFQEIRKNIFNLGFARQEKCLKSSK